MTHRLLALVGLLAAPAVSLAQNLPLKHKPQPTSAAISAADLMTRDYIIADDSMLGRQAGMIGNFKATTYIADEFRKLGLKPGGENGSFFQTISYAQRIASSWSRLVVNGTTLELWTDYAPLGPNPTARGVIFETERTEAVYGGRIGDTSVTIPAERIAGKVVVLAPAIGPDGSPVAGYFGAPGMARFRSAAAIAIANLDLLGPELIATLKLPRNVIPPDTTQRPPMLLSISTKAAALMIGGTFDAIKPGELGSSLRARVAYEFKPTEAPARNVIAILPGSDPKLRGEYIVIGAHNDHVGIQRVAVDHDSLRAFDRVMRPEGVQTRPSQPSAAQWTEIHTILDSLRKLRAPRLDSISNGADDDGSGTSVLLEIAEWFAKTSPKPKRSILFNSHTGEEAGLLGSQYFTDHPTVPRDSLVAELNMDMVGRGRAEDIKGGGPYYLQAIGSRRLSTQLGDIVDSVNTHPNATRTHTMQMDYTYDAPGHPLNRYCRSDQYMYARYGIPITQFSVGYHEDYHMVTDEPQYIDFDHMTRVALMVKDVAVALANRPERIIVDKPKPDPKGGCRQ